MPDLIRFNVPWVSPTEVDRVREALHSGHTSSGGAFSRRAGEILQAETGGASVLMTTSCTASLELSAMLLDVGPGDTVIVPSFTFTSSALAYVRAGARVLFCDIDPVNLGPDPASVAALLADPEHGPRVKAVVAVHYAGIACDVAGLRAALADRPDVALVEDNAHGLFGRGRGEPLGSFGRFATLSFHETKNFTCGEGGALVIREEADVARAWVHYDKGTDRQAYLHGQVDKYSWRDNGSSFGLSDTLAACLVAQLEEREWIQARRREIFEGYQQRLAPVADELGLTLPHVPDDCVPAYHLFHVLLPAAEMRPEVMGAMKADQVNTTFHYVPLHSSDAGRRFAARPAECPVSTDVSSRLVRLPFHNTVSSDDQDRVADALVRAVRKARG
jgi:dTDP-4-amino-4,6-dideoxygalactose transaminase